MPSNPLDIFDSGGGGNLIPRDILGDYARLAGESEDLALTAAQREQDRYNLMGAGVQSMIFGIPQYQNLLGSAGSSILSQVAGQKQEGLDRRDTEENLLARQFATPGYVSYLGQYGVNPQLAYARNMANLSPLYGNQDIIDRQLAMSGEVEGGRLASANQAPRLVSVGNQILGQGGLVNTQLTPIRQQTMRTLMDASQGRISPAVQELFTDAGGARERDILELQMGNARNRLMETSGAQGGMLERNLGALETQRALGLAEQEARRTNQQRALAADLFGIATEQGITAPQQEAALRTQAGTMYDLAGKQQIASNQLLNSNFASRAGLLQSAEQARQSGLTGSLGALDAAAARDLAARNFQQQSYVQAQNLAQQLGAQWGQNADQLRLTAPEMTAQGVNLFTQGLVAPTMPAAFLNQSPISQPGPLLAAPMSGYAGILGAGTEGAAASNMLQAEQEGGNMEAIASLAALAALIYFT